MYTLTLLNGELVKVLDTTLPANLSFVDKLSAVNYAVRHASRLGNDITTIDDTKGQVAYADSESEGTYYYVVSDIIDIRTTQYASLVTMTSPKFDASRMVLSTDELDDICSTLMYGFINYAMVNPAKRQGVATLLTSSIKPTMTSVAFADLSVADTYIDVAVLITSLKPMMVAV